ncbi:hypothetical protein NL676_026039 [Syzygium grande]|nr:hypothetical protein NL676_026039 [Syzygium grande]
MLIAESGPGLPLFWKAQTNQSLPSSAEQDTETRTSSLCSHARPPSLLQLPHRFSPSAFRSGFFAGRTMEETGSLPDKETVDKEAPQLAAVLKEIKEGLDTVKAKVQALTAKVKARQFPTAEGISYLEAKHLLLLSYCQSLVYYLLRKAKGLSIDGHPVVRSLVEMRLFLEKIRPIDKKLQYQIQKLTTVARGAAESTAVDEKETGAPRRTEDLLKYRPNPDMLVSKSDTTAEGTGGIYKPPKFSPASMGGG